MRKKTLANILFPLFSCLIVGAFNCNSVVYAIIVITYYTAFFLYDVNKNSRKAIIFIIFLLGLFARTGLIYLDAYVTEIDIGDSRIFREAAEYFFYNDRIVFRGIEQFNGTVFFMGVINKIFGPHRIILQYFNALSFLVGALYTYKLLCQLNISDKLKNILTAWIVFSPQNVINTSISNREGFISFFVAISLYLFYQYVKSKNIKPLLGSFGSVFVACILHSGVICLLIVYLLYMNKFYTSKRYKLSSSRIMTTIIVASAFFFAICLFKDVVLNKFGNLESVEDITRHTHRLDGGGSDYEVPFGENIVSTPLRAIYFLLSPMPWYWRNYGDILAFVICSSPHIAIFCSFLYKRNRIMRYTFCKMLVVASIMISLVFGWGCKNAGTAIRHRDKFLSVYSVILGLTLSSRKNEEQNCTYSTVFREFP